MTSQQPLDNIQLHNLVSGDLLAKFFPKMDNPHEWSQLMTDIFPEYGINTPNRIAMFLAQCGHETGGFAVFQENLNYSVDGLMKVFKKYFPTRDVAEQYARQPERIANRVYANRMGNGPEDSGDGWKYRGRGCIQLTGKENYTLFAKAVWADYQVIIDNPRLVIENTAMCLLTGLWYWKSRKLNQLCDNDDIVGVTRRINGGTNGLEERQHLYKILKNDFYIRLNAIGLMPVDGV